MPLYLTLELCSLFIPFILSFDKKVGFYKKWPILFPSILITGVFFILVDIHFTHKGIWGFNPQYHSNMIIAGLPLEEWLFFFVIPYSSIFIHFVLLAYFPAAVLSDKMTRIITITLIAGLTLLIVTNFNKTYTLFYCSLMIIVLIISLFEKERTINRFYISFLVILIPFYIINGILTGSFISDEVVWYNTSEIIGIRIFTVPLEDVPYGFSLILINLLLMNIFQKFIFRNPGK